MGGRGAQSGLAGGRISGFTVKFNGDTTDYFFYTVNGIHYYQRGIDGMPQETPQNMTMREFRRRIEKNGGDVKNISESKRKKLEKERKKDRERTEKWLNEQWYRAAPRPRKGWKGH